MVEKCHRNKIRRRHMSGGRSRDLHKVYKKFYRRNISKISYALKLWAPSKNSQRYAHSIELSSIEDDGPYSTELDPLDDEYLGGTDADDVEFSFSSSSARSSASASSKQS